MPSARPENGVRSTLPRTQRWMQACIQAEGAVEEAIRSPGAAREFSPGAARGLIRPSRTLAPLERLDIYRNMYQARLRDALEVDYPGLFHFLGEERFDELVRLYIAECPSRSYTLNRLGDGLPEFLGEIDGIREPEFTRDLARLELAMTQVFDEEESPAADPRAIRRVPPASWERLRLRPVRALRLLALGYPVHRYLEAMRAGTAPPKIRPRRTWLAVYRRDYALLHLPLARPSFELLSALAEGERLGAALERAHASGRLSNRAVFHCFEEWFSQRLFQEIGLERGAIPDRVRPVMTPRSGAVSPVNAPRPSGRRSAPTQPRCEGRVSP